MKVLRRAVALGTVAALLLVGSVAQAAKECVDEEAEEAALVLVPPTPADMCLLDASQCVPAAPIPPAAEVSPPSTPQILLPEAPAIVLARGSMIAARNTVDGERAGVTRELLRPPR